MKTHYYNAYHHEDGGFYIEQKASSSEQEAIEDINNYNYGKFLYAYTLEVSATGARVIDLETKALNHRYDEPEKLTGHEMGVCPGRV